MMEKIKETLKNKPSEIKRVQNGFSEELFLDLQYDESLWDSYDKLSNTYAYKLIENGRVDDVMVHIERFTPTKNLFIALLDEEDNLDFTVNWKDFFNKMPIGEKMATELADRGVLQHLDFNDFNFRIDKKLYDKLVKQSKK